ncbi:TPA: hypothetical protein ACS70U_003939, partial [Providencia alcalifaciens]
MLRHRGVTEYSRNNSDRLLRGVSEIHGRNPLRTDYCSRRRAVTVRELGMPRHGKEYAFTSGP